MTYIDLGSRVSTPSTENLRDPLSSSLLPDSDSKLPQFDIALGTRRLCFIGLAFSYLLSLGLIIGGSWLLGTKGGESDDPIWITIDALNSSAVIETLTLIFNASVTVITECLGYIHATSLRWALYHEGRLHHNSNIRLLTSSRNSTPNAWYMNAVWAILLVMAQSCASQVLVRISVSASDYALFGALVGGIVDGMNGVNDLAMLLLGLCLFLLCLLSTWSLHPTHRAQIISWSPDPLNNALALHHATPNTLATPDLPSSLPKRRQLSSSSTSGSITATVVYLWSVAIACTVGAIAWYTYIKRYPESNRTDNGVTSILLIPDYFDSSSGTLAAVNIFFLAGMQVLYALALHSTEQLVNFSRDEAAWRRAASTKGAVVGGGSLFKVFTSWEALLLLAMKPLSHWIFGLTISTFGEYGVEFSVYAFLGLTAMAIVLAMFGTFLAYRRPKGPQPALYGHLRGLRQLVDEWGKGAGGRIYWGDKGEIEGQGGMRLAGTSPSPGGVMPISFAGREYRGLVPDIELRERRGWSLPRSFTRIFRRGMSEKEKGEQEGLA